MTHSLIIAGSTAHTTLIATAIAANETFAIKAIITPEPKPIGRKQLITPNPLHQFALDHQIPTVLVKQKLDTECRTELATIMRADSASCDFLLVVDFGYYVPSWLLSHATIQPLNLHPSLLPRWRGSSPGQFVLLAGEDHSAISLITVAKAMDQGAIWHQREFAVAPEWHTNEYYHHAFSLIAPHMCQLLTDIAAGNIMPTSQPVESPTPMAGRLTKTDSFIPWAVLRAAQTGDAKWDTTAREQLQTLTATMMAAETDNTPTPEPYLYQLLRESTVEHWPTILARATKAFVPWPRLWTLAPTPKGDQRLIILETEVLDGKLDATSLQLEGKTPASWNQLKTAFVL